MLVLLALKGNIRSSSPTFSVRFISYSSRNKQDAQEALNLSPKLLLQPGDQPLYRDDAPILRRHKPNLLYGDRPVRNIVLIIMESFSSKYIGVQGSSWNITPEFDLLSKEGVLFTRFFSSGKHTHQGMFATCCRF